MGAGIAEVFIQHNFQTIVFDPDEAAILRARTRIEKKYPSAVAHFTSQMNDCRAELIIEAVIEDLEAKCNLLNAVAQVNEASTIYATNTSSLSVSEIAKNFSGPSQLAGMHFFNPAPVMKLVEIVKTDLVQDGVIETLGVLTRAVGKTPVLCKDAPGFIVNHVARPYYLEALQLVSAGNASVETIDALMEATGFRMGPFRLMDFIGNDINYSVSRIVYDALGKPARLAPSPLQEKKVKDGELGRKTGKGYYEYPTS